VQEALSYVGTCGVGVLIRGLKLLVYEALRYLRTCGVFLLILQCLYLAGKGSSR
jgi:hypothetical protein